VAIDDFGCLLGASFNIHLPEIWGGSALESVDVFRGEGVWCLKVSVAHAVPRAEIERVGGV
jgi:hypothetical protein